ncbi:MAG: hypothetical protein HOO03_09020 [Rhodobacteraceae bacterium]|nr:hypothetical protein [Paracoccaceae bacterium]
MFSGSIKKANTLKIKKQATEKYTNNFQLIVVKPALRVLHRNAAVTCSKNIPTKVRIKRPGNNKLGGKTKAAINGITKNRIRNSKVKSIRFIPFLNQLNQFL